MTLLYWILCFIIGIIPAILVYRNDKKKQLPIRWLPALLRGITFFLTAALLLAPAFTFKKNETEKPLLIWLQDRSSSFTKSIGKDAAAYHKKVKDLFSKWNKDYTVQPIGFGSNISYDSIFNYNLQSTNISDALQTVASQYQDRNIGAIILPTDGMFNEGADPLYISLGENIPVYTIGIGDSTLPQDIGIVRVFNNKTVATGSIFEVIADIRADKLNGLNTQVSLMQGSKTIKTSSIKVDKDRYITSVKFEVTASGKGFQQYSLLIPKANGEVNTHNNKLDFFVNIIDDATKILIVSKAPHPDIAAIKAALAPIPQYKVTTIISNDLPSDINQYNIVIAHQSPNTIPQNATWKQTPIWYILGSQSQMNVINQIQNTVSINSVGTANEVLPILNNSFNLFTLPKNIREIIGKLPPLQAPNGKYTVSAGSQALFQQQIGNIQTNYPLWIFKPGTVPQAILAGEGLWKWRIYEYKNFNNHDVTDELIRQTVSFLSVRKDNQPFKVFMDKYVLTDNEPIYLYAELRNANAELINTPEVNLSIKDSSGKALQYHFEKSGNSYRINLGLLAPGTYNFAGTTLYNGMTYESKGSFIVESIPLESLRTNADYQMLYQLASQTGGHFFTYNNFSQSLTDSLKANKNISSVIHTQETSSPLIDKKWLFFIILLFVALEWFLRKYWSV